MNPICAKYLTLEQISEYKQVRSIAIVELQAGPGYQSRGDSDFVSVRFQAVLSGNGAAERDA